MTPRISFFSSVPSIDDIIAFFVALLNDVESFVDGLLREFLLDPLQEFADQVNELQDALNIIAGKLPEPDPELRRQVLTLYDVQKALLEYERQNLRSLLLNRYKALAKIAKETFTNDALKELVRQLVRLKWGAALSFVLKHALTIALAAVAADELYKSLSEDLAGRFSKKVLGQNNARHYASGRHRTRKK